MTDQPAEAPDHRGARSMLERIFALLNEHDTRHIPAMFTEDIVFVDDAAPETLSGHAEMEEFLASLWRAMPDFRFELADGPYVSEDGRHLAARVHAGGTLTGRFDPPGFAPTGTGVSTEYGGFYEFEGDRVKRARIIVNMNEVGVQIGAAPAPGSLGERVAVGIQRLAARRMRKRSQAEERAGGRPVTTATDYTIEPTRDPVHRARYAFEADGENMTVDAWIEPGGGLPAHHHPRQEERWSVISGEVRFQLGATKRVITAEEGEIVVSAGTRHSIAAVADREAHLRCYVVPALGIRAFLEDSSAAAREGLFMRGGIPRGLRGARWAASFLERHRDDVVMTFPPPPVVHALIALFGRSGSAERGHGDAPSARPSGGR